MLRPVTLRRIVRVLSDLSGDRGFSTSNELGNFLSRLGLIDEGGITPEGVRFMGLVSEGRADEVHRFFMERLGEYREVYAQLTRGVYSPGEIADVTGLNFLVIDIVMRLIAEVEQLSTQGTSFTDAVYDNFRSEFIESYKSLVRRYRSRYVPIRDVVAEVRARMPLPSAIIEKLLIRMRERERGRVSFVQAPLIKPTSSKGLRIGGRTYSYVILYQ